METDEVEKDAANAAPKAKEHALIAADLEKVTDYAEENVISGQDMSNVSCSVPYLSFYVVFEQSQPKTRQS